LSFALLFVTINGELGSIEAATFDQRKLDQKMIETLWVKPTRRFACCAKYRFVAVAICAFMLLGCGATGPRPLSIKMFNPKTNTTLDCRARDLGLADPNMLANSVETCAQQLEKSGFVRQSSEPPAATKP